MRSLLPCAAILVVFAATAAAAGNSAPPPPLLGLPVTSQLPTTPQPPVTLTINPDGTAVWDGEPLAGVPQLQDKLAHQTLQDPKLQLDLHFHTVGELSDSNRQTLLQVLELAARFGYVHVQATADGAQLTVLGPTTVKSAPK